jgi:hypothetical protein
MSHHMLPGVQRVWGNQPSHSQVNSHGGSWSPKWTPKTSESDFRGQNPMACDIFYIIGKFLELICLKWIRIAHLDISNTSYGQKKGRKLNYWFLTTKKVGKRPNLVVYIGCATYHWKALNGGYNFASDHNSIGGLLAKLWGYKATRVPTWTISGLPLGSLGTKSHLDVASMQSHKVYYKGEGGGFPQVWAVVNLVCPCCTWFFLTPKVFQLCTNHLVWVLCRPVWVSEACQLFLVPSRSSSTPFYPSKCCEPWSVPRFLPLLLLSTWTHIWVGSASHSLFVCIMMKVTNKLVVTNFWHFWHIIEKWENVFFATSVPFVLTRISLKP